MSVIYENPAAPLPEWARWMAKEEETALIFPRQPGLMGWGWFCHGEGWCCALSYTIPGPWRDSLRRIIRLSDPKYYEPGSENPHTDDEGFLPHDGGVMPEWCRGKLVEFYASNSVASHYALSDSLITRHVTAYRIVGDGSAPEITTEEENQRASGRIHAAMGKDRKRLYARSENVGDGSEDQEAGEPDPRALAPAFPCGLSDYGLRKADYAAIHLGVPVPGMSSWLEAPLREARRLRYREAALQAVVIRNQGGDFFPLAARNLADDMIEQENNQ